ncbi:YdeI family protein [Spirosoma soli]|uniref:YdeI family protein n=1 Tax=Spirosoma soli TaxID=1770529 RepID=A0ABW5M2H2_9BACT
MQTPNAIYAESRAAWRQWLADHHAIEKSVWLKLYKKNSSTPSVTYDEAVDEALCFGWIDSSVKKGDDEYRLQFFAKRNPKSNWSRVNKNKVERLTQAGLMTEAGQAMIDLAKRTGTWAALDDVENLINPPDLQAQLDVNPTAKSYFDAFPRSAKRGILEWLLNAKTAQTRAKRIMEIVTLAEQNKRANQYIPKSGETGGLSGKS